MVSLGFHHGYDRGAHTQPWRGRRGRQRAVRHPQAAMGQQRASRGERKMVRIERKRKKGGKTRDDTPVSDCRTGRGLGWLTRRVFHSVDAIPPHKGTHKGLHCESALSGICYVVSLLSDGESHPAGNKNSARDNPIHFTCRGRRFVPEERVWVGPSIGGNLQLSLKFSSYLPHSGCVGKSEW